jgi:hypothetical protein
LQEFLEDGAHPAQDLDRGAAELADLGDAQGEEVLPMADRNDDASLRRTGLPGRRRQVGLAYHPQAVAEVIEHLHRGRRVVDRRREGLARHVHHDPERERGILLDRPLEPQCHEPAQGTLRGVDLTGVPVHLIKRVARLDELAD